jgi:hypothetical protein
MENIFRDQARRESDPPDGETDLQVSSKELMRPEHAADVPALT